MISTWDELLTHLNIDENALTDNDMRGLLSWYKTHLSSEKKAAHYNEIKHDLNHYFDTLPHYSQHDRLEARVRSKS